MKNIYEVDQECAEFLAFKEEHETALVKEATQHGVLLASSFFREKCLELMFQVSQLQKEHEKNIRYIRSIEGLSEKLNNLNLDLGIENQKLKEALENKSKQTAQKFIEECKKYKVKKFNPIGIDQRDTGVSCIEIPEWKFDEFAKQFSVEIKE